MGKIEDTRATLEQVAALRRAEAQAPTVREISEVRGQLEQRLGGSVNMSTAARVLGVSRTTVNRWVQRGELPVVITPAGKREVPLEALIDLRDSVRAHQDAGRGHVIEPIVLDAHRFAEQMPSPTIEGEATDGHDRAQRRALAYHRQVARALRRADVARARQRIWDWRAREIVDGRLADQWEELLSAPVPEVARRISEDSPRMRDLRQSSPFAGKLPEAARNRIFREVT